MSKFLKRSQCTFWAFRMKDGTYYRQYSMCSWNDIDCTVPLSRIATECIESATHFYSDVKPTDLPGGDKRLKGGEYIRITVATEYTETPSEEIPYFYPGTIVRYKYGSNQLRSGAESFSEAVVLRPSKLVLVSMCGTMRWEHTVSPEDFEEVGQVDDIILAKLNHRLLG